MDNTTDEGTPNAFELSWLHAKPFIEEGGEPPAYRKTAAQNHRPCLQEGGVEVVVMAMLGFPI